MWKLIVIYFVPVPVGNLKDITLRAIEVLSSAEIILAEDPRVTKKLLDLLEIKKTWKFISFGGIRSEKKLAHLESVLKESKHQTIAVVSDAGTPGISDPGNEIVQLCLQLDLKFTVLPGPSCLIPAIVLSGLIRKEFLFLGFLPTKKGRQLKWKKIAKSTVPVVIFESTYRLEKFLIEAQSHLNENSEIAVVKEISKSFETVWRFRIKDLQFQNINYKGEFVVIILPQESKA